MNSLEQEIEQIIKDARRDGNVITDEDLGAKLINYELSIDEMKEVKD